MMCYEVKSSTSGIHIPMVLYFLGYIFAFFCPRFHRSAISTAVRVNPWIELYPPNLAFGVIDSEVDINLQNLLPTSF